MRPGAAVESNPITLLSAVNGLIKKKGFTPSKTMNDLDFDALFPLFSTQGTPFGSKTQHNGCSNCTRTLSARRVVVNFTSPSLSNKKAISRPSQLTS